MGSDGHAGGHTLQGVGDRYDRTFVEGFRIDGRHRTGDVDLLLSTVTDDNDIVDGSVVAFEYDPVVSLVGNGYRCILISDVGDCQLLAGTGCKLELARVVGRCPPPGLEPSMTITVAPTSGVPSVSVTVPPMVV